MGIENVYGDIERVIKRIEEIKSRFYKLNGYYSNRFKKELLKKTSVKSPEINKERKEIKESKTVPEKSDNLKDKIIEKAAQRYGIPEELIRALIKQESNFNERAVSKKGAMGLMQLMPETAKLLGVNNPFDIEENIFGGTRYLRDLINLYGGNLNKALAAYNAGPTRVKEDIPDIPETKSFVKSVIENYKSFMKYRMED